MKISHLRVFGDRSLRINQAPVRPQWKTSIRRKVEEYVEAHYYQPLWEQAKKNYEEQNVKNARVFLELNLHKPFGFTESELYEIRKVAGVLEEEVNGDEMIGD